MLTNPINSLYLVLANTRVKRLKHETSHVKEYQEQLFKALLKNLRKTKFGEKLKAQNISSFSQFKSAIQMGGYEDKKPWIMKCLDGESDVLWPGSPLYFGLTSGTTSGTKYIPINESSISNQTSAGITAIANYIHESGSASCLMKKSLHIQANPLLEMHNGFPTGPLSGIIAHHFPKIFGYKKLPSQNINCIKNWNSKIDLIVQESLKKPISILGGVTSWILMYMEKLIKYRGVDHLNEVMPSLRLIMHGGVSYTPYMSRFEKITGKSTGKIELYSATEGFIAFQDKIDAEGLLLLPNNGVFFEFAPSSSFDSSTSKTFLLDQIELNEEYTPVISTNSGLWRYVLGDTVKFVSKNPYRLVVSGRVGQFISTFGEHVVEEDTRKAIVEACMKNKCSIRDYSVAPYFGNQLSHSCHEWFIEFLDRPLNMERFRTDLDRAMQNRNLFYKNLILGNVLEPLIVTVLKDNSFNNFLMSKGKHSGQNKVVHISNKRNFVEELQKFLKEAKSG